MNGKDPEIKIYVKPELAKSGAAFLFDFLKSGKSATLTIGDSAPAWAAFFGRTPRDIAKDFAESGLTDIEEIQKFIEDHHGDIDAETIHRYVLEYLDNQDEADGSNLPF